MHLTSTFTRDPSRAPKFLPSCKKQHFEKTIACERGIFMGETQTFLGAKPRGSFALCKCQQIPIPMSCETPHDRLDAIIVEPKNP